MNILTSSSSPAVDCNRRMYFLLNLCVKEKKIESFDDKARNSMVSWSLFLFGKIKVLRFSSVYFPQVLLGLYL